jgi:uncharacterized damage-inducible protein DinB
MQVSDVYLELFGRIPELATRAVDGLTPEQLVTQFEADTNPIGWLVWHLTRVQDHHVAELLEEPQLWETGDWPSRFGLDADPQNIGYGHKPADVAKVRPDSADVLVEYCDAVHTRTEQFLGALSAKALDRVVDDRWDPPVTLGVRLVSVADDGLQHAGQAAYLRGLLGW